MLYFFYKQNMKKIFNLLWTVWVLVLASISNTSAYTNEQHEAYYWAYEMGITNATSIEKADMYWAITRVEMTEMLSNFAKNLLWNSSDSSKNCSYTDIWSLDKKLQESIVNACKLWIIGQWNQKFRPNDMVSRAEFWTALSRVLRQNTYDGWKPYYVKHLKALKDAGISSNSPYANEILESKWHAFLMIKNSYDLVNWKHENKTTVKNQTMPQVKTWNKNEIISTWAKQEVSTWTKVSTNTWTTQAQQTTTKSTNQYTITYSWNSESEFIYDSWFINQLVNMAKKQWESHLAEYLEIELNYLNNPFKMENLDEKEFAKSLWIDLDNLDYDNMTQKEREQLVKKFKWWMNDLINENKENNNNFIKNLEKVTKKIGWNDKFWLKEKYEKYEEFIVSANWFLDVYMEIVWDLMETTIMYGDEEELENDEEMIAKSFWLIWASLAYYSEAQSFQEYLNKWWIDTLELLGGKLVKE